MRSSAVERERAVDERAGRAEVVVGRLGVDAEAAASASVPGRCSRASARRRPAARRASGEPRPRRRPWRRARSERMPFGVPGTGRALVLAARGPRAGSRHWRARAARRRAPARRRPGSACAAWSTIRRLAPRPPRPPRSARAARCRPRSSPALRAAPASAPPSSATGSRSVCHGTTGSRRPSAAAKRSQHVLPARRTQRASRPRRRAARATASRPSSRRPRVDEADEPARRLQRRTSSAPPAAAAFAPPSPCRGAPRPGARTGRRHRRARDRRAPSAPRATSIAAVSRMSWLVAPRCTSAACSPPTWSRIARNERDHRVAAGTSRHGELGGVVEIGVAGCCDGRRRRGVDQPRSGLASASARSAASSASEPGAIRDGGAHVVPGRRWPRRASRGVQNHAASSARNAASSISDGASVTWRSSATRRSQPVTARTSSTETEG